MAKKAKIRVRGYLPDLISWFQLPKKRKAWIESGNPELDTRDPIEDLAKKLHPGLTEAEIVSIDQETPSSRTFTLRPSDGKPAPLYYAGQYLCLYVQVGEHTVCRPFALSSRPADALDKGLIQFTLKKKNGGFVSEHLWNNVKVGDHVHYDAPFGELSYSALRDAPHVVGIAGGSGITVFRSIMLDMQDSHRPQKLTLLYGSRNADDILFRDELDALAAKSEGNIEIIHILSEADASWQGEKGFISAELIQKYVPNYADVSFYVSGPPALYDFAKIELDKLRIRPSRRRMESYGESPDIAANSAFPRDQLGKTYRLTVRFGVDERVIEAKSTETVVQALDQAGLAIDTRCRSGSCGWCRSLLEAGEVWQRPEGDGVRARDKDVGYFHPCSAYPVSDLTVRVFTQI